MKRRRRVRGAACVSAFFNTFTHSIPLSLTHSLPPSLAPYPPPLSHAASEGEPTPARGPRMLAAVDDRAAEAFLAGTSLRSEREAPMGQRAGSAGAGVAAGAGRRAVGPQEVTFVPQTVEGEGEGEGRGGRKGGRGGRGRGRGRGGRGGVGKRGGRGGRGGRR